MHMQEGKRYIPRNAGKLGRADVSDRPRSALSQATAARKSAMARTVSRALFLVASGYLLGGCRLFFGSYPLGLALLCAAGAGAPYALPGLVASAIVFTPYPPVYIGAYIVALILRIVTRVFIDTADAGDPSESRGAWLRNMRGGLFTESVSLRMTTASVCAFIIGLYSLIAGDYRYYDLLGALVSIVAAPAAVWLLAGFFAGESKSRLRYLCGVGLLLGALAYSAREIYIMGISLAVFGAFFVTLALGRKFGILEATAAGLICGLAVDPLYAPVFVLAAITDGLLYKLSPMLSVGAALGVGIIWGLYMDGLGALTALFPALLLSAALFGGASRAGLLDKPAVMDKPAARVVSRREERLAAEVEVAEKRQKAHEERLRAISESFASLSEVFYNLSDRLRRPGILDLRRICDKNFERACSTCARREICWGLEYGATLEMVAAVCTQLHERGRAETDNLPEPIKRRCDRLGSIISSVNAGCASLIRSVLSSEKISLFALDYDAISKILLDLLEEQRSDLESSSDCEQKAAAALKALGLEPQVLLVRGGRRKYICARGLAPGESRLEATALRRALEEACGCRLEEPLIELSSDSPDGGADYGSGLSVCLSSRRKYSVESAWHRSPSENDAEGVCGDSVCTLENQKDYFYALISDGMGTGSQAALASGISSLFLEKMLSAGNPAKTALRMLNGVLRSRTGSREGECSATVDLLEIDLLSGEAALIKSGAAPTYIRRRGDIFKLHSKTLPIGILTALDAQQTKLELQDKDIIVMVSDGVSDAAGTHDSEGSWLPELLSREWEDDLGRMAKKIVGRAQSLGSRDDLSVVVIRVNAES